MQLFRMTPPEAQRLVEQLLRLPAKAWRPPFQKMARRYQAELAQTFKHYQIAHDIQLPNGQPALQTQAYHRDLLIRRIISFMTLLNGDTVQTLRKGSSPSEGNQDRSK